METNYWEIFNLKQSRKELLSALVSPQRFAHSVGVAETARRFSGFLNVDPKSAEIAGLFHDVAKDLPLHISRNLDYPSFLEPDKTEMNNKGLIHGPASAAIAWRYMGIDDKPVLEAIRYHVTGRPELTDLDKAVLLADICEPNRDLKDLRFIRELAKRNIDFALLVWIYVKYLFVVNLGIKPHPRTMETLLSFPKDLLTRAKQIIENRGIGKLRL